MRLRSSRAFTLIEVLITVGILSTAIIFVFRSLAACLGAAKFSQNITQGCLLAERKFWDAQVKQKLSTGAIPAEFGDQEAAGRKYKWSYSAAKTDAGLVKLLLSVSWKENVRAKDYAMDFVTYLTPENSP